MDLNPKSIAELPSVPARYNIAVRGCMSIVPMFASFNGTDWEDLPSWASKEDVFYYDHFEKETQ